MAENLDGCHYKDFWANIKKIKGNKKVYVPATVDSAGDVESIGSLFHEKYKNLYNCVSYDDHQMAALKLQIDNKICQSQSQNYFIEPYTMKMQISFFFQ